MKIKKNKRKRKRKRRRLRKLLMNGNFSTNKNHYGLEIQKILPKKNMLHSIKLLLTIGKNILQ